MTEEERRLKALVRTRDSERREMCIAGIELKILSDDDIAYICDMRNSIVDVRYFYRCKIMEK